MASVIYLLNKKEGVSAFPLEMNSLPPAVFPKDHKGGPGPVWGPMGEASPL